MQEMKFTVANVKCGGCAANIEGGLASELGVTQVSVDVSGGEVQVQGDTLNRDALIAKLTELGYPLVNS